MAYTFSVRALTIAGTLLFWPFGSHTAVTSPAPTADSAHKLKRTYATTETSSDGSSGGSNGHTAIIERVIAVRENGVELEFDYPNDVTAEDRAREWQMPVRVFKPLDGPLQLLNGGELEARRDDWLKRAKLPREACGSWYFTWNAFKVECDPQAALMEVAAYDLGPSDLRSAPTYSDPDATHPAPLVRSAIGPTGATYVARLVPDANAVRRARAEADVVVAQINREQLTLESALRARSAEQVSGEIIVTFTADALGRPFRKTKVAKLRIKNRDGVTEDSTGIVTLERQPLR